ARLPFGRGRFGRRGLSPLSGAAVAVRASGVCPRWLERTWLGSGLVELALMIEGQEGVTWDDWLALAGACEEHGVGTMFRSDHYVSFSAPDRAGSLDAWTQIAALAPRTTTLRLGTLGSPATFRHPSTLANAVVTADHASGGRAPPSAGPTSTTRRSRPSTTCERSARASTTSSANKTATRPRCAFR